MRSFKSFMRTVPPNPSPEKHKPLPPTPSTLKSLTERTSSVTSWRMPAEWEWNHPSPSSQPLQNLSLFSARDYSPLLPEPSPGVGERQTGPISWPFQSSALQKQRSKPIQEGPSDTPDQLPRNPSESLHFQTPSSESNHGSAMPSMHGNTPDPELDVSVSASYPETSPNLRLQTALPELPDSIHRVSDASTKAKAFASLGIGSPRDSEATWEDWANNPDVSQVKDDAPPNLTLRSKNIHPLHLGNTKVEDSDLTNKLQQLSFAQDYHKVLTQQYHESDRHDQAQQMLSPFHVNGFEHSASLQPKAPSRDHELVPQPLAWKKENDLSPAHSSTNLQSEPNRRQRGITSWVHLHHQNVMNKRHDNDRGAGKRLINEVVMPNWKQIPQSGVDRILS